MKVWFPLTQQEDIMLLHYVQGDDSVLEGHFENDPQVEISVSINNAELSQKITVRLLEIIHYQNLWFNQLVFLFLFLLNIPFLP